MAEWQDDSDTSEHDGQDVALNVCTSDYDEMAKRKKPLRELILATDQDTSLVNSNQISVPEVYRERTWRTVSMFTGSIAPFSVKMARIRCAGVTSKAGL